MGQAASAASVYNHYPLIGRRPPGSCSLPGDTANPFAPITCPSCRDRLAAKVAAERKSSVDRRASAQEQAFHASTADMWARVLDVAA
jgi:hypothetical protein